VHGVIASLNILLIGRNVKQYVVLLFALFLLAGCSPAPEVGDAFVNESASVFNDEQIKSQIESTIARSEDLPQQIGVQVLEGVVILTGVLDCEGCGGMRTPGNLGTVQQSLGAVVRAVEGVQEVIFDLSLES
jgi:hypothetical protein